MRSHPPLTGLFLHSGGPACAQVYKESEHMRDRPRICAQLAPVPTLRAIPFLRPPI
jgi:hypothetical protein